MSQCIYPQGVDQISVESKLYNAIIHRFFDHHPEHQISEIPLDVPINLETQAETKINATKII